MLKLPVTLCTGLKGVAPTMATRSVVSFGVACVTTPVAVLGWTLTIVYPQSHPPAHLATLAVAGGIAVIAWISLIIGWHTDRVIRQLETIERRMLVHLIDNAVNGGGADLPRDLNRYRSSGRTGSAPKRI